VILVGAGASYACADIGDAEHSPLTRQLFDCREAQPLLSVYTLAREARSVITRDMTADTTIAFEEALRRLETDGYPHHQQMALGVPPFLQALLLKYSQNLDTRCERYGILVDELLKLQAPLMFVSVNYDTLLDNRLAAYSPLNTMADYVTTPLGWSLIKPHGSVAWFVEQPAQFAPRTPAGDLEIVTAPIQCMPTTIFDLGVVRGRRGGDPHGPSVRYPALALPNGPKEELVLPPEHRVHFEQVIGRSHEIYLLVLGYSALDTEILKLIAASTRQVRRMTVVNSDAEAALDVFERVEDAGINAIYPDVFDGSYQRWVDGGGLSRWADEYMGRPESANDPDQVRRAVAGRADERVSER